MRDAGQVTRYMYPAAASQQRTDVLWWNTRLRLALEQKR